MIVAHGVGRLILRTAGRAALQRALSPYVAVAIGASIVFGGNGLSPTAVAEMCTRSLIFRAALNLGWALISMPAVRALLATESTFVFRALPISRLTWLSWTAALLGLAELPWTLLWLTAGGLVPALAETCWVLAVSALALSRFSRSALFRAALLGLVLLLQPGPYARFLIALPVAALTTYEVWLRAPELHRAPPRAWVRGPAALALSLSYVVVLARTAAAQLVRGLALVTLATGIAYLHLRNSGGDARLTALAALTPALLAALAGVTGPLLSAERELGWLLAWTRTGFVARRFGAFAALAGLALAGALSGAAVLVMLRPLSVTERLALLGQLSLASTTLASMVLGAARWAVRDTGRDAARLLFGVAVVGLAALLSLDWLGGRGVLLWCPVAGLALFGKRDAPHARASPTRRIEMLEIAQVCKRLGTRRVLDGVSATCGAGEVLVVLGENGAGKSTLLRVVAGIVEPDSGAITLQGAGLHGGNREARRHLGYAPDATQTLPDLLVEELLELVRALKTLPHRLASELEARWWGRLGVDLLHGQRLSTLSFGQRKRVLTAAALAGNPWLLVLDEPSNGLDPAGSSLMLELIAERRARGQATLLASNDAPFVAQLAGKAYHLGGGRLTNLG